MKFQEGTEWFHNPSTKPKEYFVENVEVVVGKSFPLSKGKLAKITKGWEQRNYAYATKTIEK